MRTCLIPLDTFRRAKTVLATAPPKEAHALT